MTFKKYILVLFFALGAVASHAQQDTTHTFIGVASGAKTFLPAGAAISDSVNISWSIGEVVVFEDSETKVTGAPSRFTIAQAMQSYPPFLPVKNCPKITVKGASTNLCGTSFNTILSYKAEFPIVQSVDPLVDSLQWYFSEDTSKFVKIAGATDISKLDYQPFFSGYYRVCVKYKGTSCKNCSDPVLVSNFSASISPPLISESGSPVNLLTATTSGTPSSSIQWYVSYNNKYLMIAGGSNPTQKIRYNGDYMVVATYGTCRLSSFHSVRSQSTSIMRAEDVTYDATTIYIPDEMAYSESTLKVYPNPATGQFFVQFQSSSEITTNAQLFSNTGVLVKNIAFTEGSTWSRSARVDTDDLGSGVYFLKVDQEGKSLVQKVVLYK